MWRTKALPPKHVNGFCDIGDCRELACWAYRDGDLYVEVCGMHAEKLEGQFDSDYTRVRHDSPYRDGARRTLEHECGGTVMVYDAPEWDEYRVCSDCGYALLIREKEGEGFEVRHSGSAG